MTARHQSRLAAKVGWTENEYERGSLVGTSRWTAILSVIVRQPVSAEILRKNPLGLYVDAIDWSRELETSKPDAQPVGPRADQNLPLGSPLDPGLAAMSASSTAIRNSQ